MVIENPDVLISVLGVSLIAAVAALIVSLVAHKNSKQQAQAAALLASQMEITLEGEIDAAQKDLQQLQLGRVELESQNRHFENQVNRLQQDNAAQLIHITELAQQKTEAERQNAILRTELDKEREAHTERMQIVETMKIEAITAAKSATLASARELSSKLLDDHKRQSDEAKKQSEEQVRKTTEHLVHSITEVNKNIHALNSDVTSNRNTMDTVMRALSSPGGAGQYSEIGLENTLTSFGLVKGRDFVVQQQLDSKRLRPDALVFLPGNTVLVIDSKASKFLLDLAEAEDEQQQSIAYANLAKTMNGHLKGLADKNYKAEVVASYKESGRMQGTPQVFSIMYLPNEGAIEKVSIADPQFHRKASKLQITLAGPAALNCLIGMARVQLDVERQSENQERIVEGAQMIVESIGVIVEKTVNVGKGLKTAAKSYNDLTGSINKRLLPRVQKLVSYGVQSNRHKRLPGHVPTFDFTEHERGDLIEGDAEEVQEQAALTNQTESKD
ncbi:MAG: DNA recombination protein RmuC [Rhodospirillales bacterium]|nr:DNA recombination protein RmuC [Rhodospirillales bacterium]